MSSVPESSYDRSATDATTFTYRGGPATRALIFNCTSGRSGLSLLGALTSSLSAGQSSVSAQPFEHVIFCTNTTYASGSSKGGELRREFLVSPSSSKLIPIPSPLVVPRRRLPPPRPPVIPSEDLTSNAVDAKDLETLATQRELASAWDELVESMPSGSEGQKAKVHVLGSIEEAIDVVRQAAGEKDGEVQALVTGSLHLVGGVMAVADLPL